MSSVLKNSKKFLPNFKAKQSSTQDTIPSQNLNSEPSSQETLISISQPEPSLNLEESSKEQISIASTPSFLRRELPPLIMSKKTESQPEQPTRKINIPFSKKKATRRPITQETDENSPESLSISALIDTDFSHGIQSETHLKRMAEKKESRKLKRSKSKSVSEQEPIIKASPPPPTIPEIESQGPRIRVENGKIVIDESSLFIHQDTETIEMEHIEESNKHITNASFRNKPISRMHWTPVLENQFYKALSYFGTDFSMIHIFMNSIDEGQPQLTRRIVKLKFTNEERYHSDLITKYLNDKKIPGVDVWERMKSYVKSRKESEVTG